MAWPLLAGAVCCLVGSPLITMICNVPLNDRLAATGAESAEAMKFWPECLRRGLPWNHRTVLCLAATGLLAGALSRA